MVKKLLKSKFAKLLTLTALQRRLLILCCFIALDALLLNTFIQDYGPKLSPTVQQQLSKLGFSIPESAGRVPQTFSLTSPELLTAINDFRTENNTATLSASAQLDTVAQALLQAYESDNWKIAQKSYKTQLTDTLVAVKYNYLLVSNTGLVGPTQTKEVMDIWLQDASQSATLLSKDYSDVGTAIKQIELDGKVAGAVVQVYAKPKPSAAPPSPSSKKASTAQSTFIRDIPDDEVVRALNEYRASHGVHQLLIDQHLCTYAAKRAQDLVAYGGLDHHEGFKKDFADPNNIPQSIKEYSGGSIGENLASQFCINGTTGQVFTAQTGTALIEWCFDSSIKGHREAQLNPRYNAVCSRHAQNMYVITFGE